MRRPNRNVEIFSLSSLDLFASAMGAFVVITMLLFPSYLKTNQILSKSANMESEIDKVKEEIAESKRLEAEAQVPLEMVKVIEQRKASEAEIKILDKQAKMLQDEIKKSVKFVFLGMETKADSFTLVLDMSGSMKEYRELTFDTVDRIINSLPSDKSLTIIGFHIPGNNPVLRYWPAKGQSGKASLGNKKAAGQFVRQLSQDFKGATPTYDALQAALEYNNEAIILLTDGSPTYPEGITPNQVQNLITTANAGKKEIHTVGLGKYNADPIFLDFLEGLANKNRGNFMALSR